MSQGPRKAASQAAKRVSGKAAGRLLKKGFNAINPVECIREIAAAHGEYRKIVEQETTRRVEIASNERIALERIAAQREALMQYLTLSFDERRSNFEQLFARLDSAIETGDSGITVATLGAIVELGKSSPFAALASVQNVRAVLADPKKQFEF